MPRPGRPTIRLALALALLSAAVSLVAVSQRDFWAPDEPDFAECTREMLQRRSLLLPYQNGVPYSEKPILFYWAMAASSPLTGGDVHPVGTRLPSVLAGAALVFGAAWYAGRGGGSREALVAGLVTASAPLVLWQSQFLQIDALFTALLFFCFVAMREAMREEAVAWRWAFHLLLPLAVLTKGPLAVVLCGLVAVVLCVANRSLGPVRVLDPVRGALVFLVLVVPWYALAIRAGGPLYAYDLVVRQNWIRFFHAFDHIKPWWYYLTRIWEDFMPWTIPALLAPLVLRRSGALTNRRELRYALVVIAVCFSFLSASGSKQGKYLLVAYPFAAALVAAAVSEAERLAFAGDSRALRAQRAYAAAIAVILGLAGVALVPVARARVPEWARLAPPIAATLVVGSVATLWLLGRFRREAAPAAAGLALTLLAGATAAAVTLFPALDEGKTGRAMYERIRPLVSHGEPLAYFGDPYRCYAILRLRRTTQHFTEELELWSWVRGTPGARVLVNRKEFAKWRRPELTSLRVLDRAPVGRGEVLFLGRP